MKRISNTNLLINYIHKHSIDNIFDIDLFQYMELHYYKKNEVILKAENKLKYYYLLVMGRLKFHIFLKMENQFC